MPAQHAHRESCWDYAVQGAAPRGDAQQDALAAGHVPRGAACHGAHGCCGTPSRLSTGDARRSCQWATPGEHEVKGTRIMVYSLGQWCARPDHLTGWRSMRSRMQHWVTVK